MATFNPLTQTTPGGWSAGRERVAFGRLLWVTPLAAGAAALANALLYLVAIATGAIPADLVLPQIGGPLTLGAVVSASSTGAIGGAFVLALIGWLARRPVRTFRAVAAAVLVLSFAMPLSTPDALVSVVLTLLLMHILAAALSVGLLTSLARAR